MLDCDRADISVSVDVEQCVLIEITCFGHWGVPKLDEKRIRISEVANLHGVNLRSKNALIGMPTFNPMCSNSDQCRQLGAYFGQYVFRNATSPLRTTRPPIETLHLICENDARRVAGN